VTESRDAIRFVERGCAYRIVYVPAAAPVTEPSRPPGDGRKRLIVLSNAPGWRPAADADVDLLDLATGRHGAPDDPIARELVEFLRRYWGIRLEHPAPSAVGGDAGEPSLGANWTTGKVMFQAGLTAARVSFDDSVSPPNATWQDVSWPTSSLVSLDPIGYMDNTATGSRWFSSQLSGTTSLAAFTDDDGANWLPSEGGPLNGGVDHQTFGGGPYHAPLTGTIYPHAIYYCSQDLVAALCARSDTGGATFAPAVPIYTDECGGLHGHVKVGPDGTVYVPNRACDGSMPWKYGS